MNARLAGLLFLWALGSNARADGDCNKDGLCVGDQTWAFYQGKLHAGQVKSFHADGRVDFQAADAPAPQPIGADRVAITKTGACLPQFQKACVGYQSWRNGGDGHPAPGRVMGYFTTGYLAVSENGNTVSLAANAFTDFRDKDCSKDLRLCVGDEAFLDTGQGLHLAKIEAVDAEAARVKADGLVVASADVASIGRNACGTDSKKLSICPGEPVLRNSKLGALLGAFPDGTLVLGSADGVARVAGKELTLHQPEGEEEHDMLVALAGLDHINDLLGVANWQDCSGVAPPAGAHSLVPGAPLACDEPNGPINGDDSPNVGKFRDLLARGAAAPLSDFLTLWYPDRGDGLNLGSPFFRCEEEENGYFSNMQPGCQPDVLFSWGPLAKEQDVMSHLADGQAWSGGVVTHYGVAGGTVFTSISAASTFGYGDVLLRFKIKPGAGYASGSMQAPANTVSVRQDMYHDFTVSDPNTIESVSTGTPEIYDEVVRDVLHFRSGQRTSVYWNTGGTGLNKLYSQQIDGHYMDENGLKVRLLALIRTILAGEGKIIYRGGACRNRALTFTSQNPNYIEPAPGPDAPPPDQAPPPPAAPAVVAPAPQAPHYYPPTPKPAPVPAPAPAVHNNYYDEDDEDNDDQDQPTVPPKAKAKAKPAVHGKQPAKPKNPKKAPRAAAPKPKEDDDN